MGDRLANKVTVVTGAGSGLGRASALRFAAEGAAVAVVDLNADAARATAAAVTADGGRAWAFALDVCDAEALATMVRDVNVQWGAIDVMYANAGVSGHSTALTCTRSEWDRVVSVNLTGSWLCSQAVLGGMIEQGSGSIILQASGAGLRGIARTFAYAAAKGGIVSMCRQMAVDFGPSGIRVNTIAPGTIRTPMSEAAYVERLTRQGVQDASVDDALLRVSSTYPMRRLGEVTDCANLALFLASDESAWITGVTFPLDGGLTASRPLWSGDEPGPN